MLEVDILLEEGDSALKTLADEIEDESTKEEDSADSDDTKGLELSVIAIEEPRVLELLTME